MQESYLDFPQKKKEIFPSWDYTSSKTLVLLKPTQTNKKFENQFCYFPVFVSF